VWIRTASPVQKRGNLSVRKSAVENLTDQALLSQIAQNDEYSHMPSDCRSIGGSFDVEMYIQ